MIEGETYQGSSRVMKRHAKGLMEIKFDDGWSAGDKGRSPQLIPGMGAARHRAAMVSFQLAHAAGLPTHFEREIADAFVVKELSVPTHESLSRETHGEVLNGEWIWRTHLEGSLWARVQAQKIDPFELGFDRGYIPKKGEKLPRIKLECTTKFEPIDRKVSDDEARELMRLTTDDWSEAWNLIAGAVAATTAVAEQAGFYQPDGKLELGRLHNGCLIIADTFGTQDENRIIRQSDGELFSKDIIRSELTRLGYAGQLKLAQRDHPNDPTKWPEYPHLSDHVTSRVTSRYAMYADAYEQAAA
ncbi:MAG: phosphoribosylaminoimidazolesuccinocarboxamide synthase [Patescibacteria group bacterium]